MSLSPVLIAVSEAIEGHSVGGDTIPALRAGHILHQIHPFVGIGDVLVLMTVLLSHRNAKISRSKGLELVIEGVEHY